MIPGQFDTLTKALPRQTRRSAMRTLGSLLTLIPGVAGAKANQSSGGSAIIGGKIIEEEREAEEREAVSVHPPVRMGP